MSTGKAFGAQTPTMGETAVSWQTWDDGAGGAPTTVGDTDWGKLKLDLDPGKEGRSAVYDMGSAVSRTFNLTENRYGSGLGAAVQQIRGDTSVFTQDAASPIWQTYSGAFSATWRYVQVRITTKFVLLPQNLLTSSGSLTEDFETIGDWTATEGSVADDATNYKTGAHSIAITTASGASGRAHKTVTWDISSNQRFLVYFRNTASAGDNPSLYFFSDAGEANYVRYKTPWTPIAGMGWHAVHFHSRDFLNDGSSPTMSSIIRYRCRHVAPSSVTRTANFDGFYIGMQGTAAIWIDFEDEWDEHYTAASYMTSHGMCGNFSISTDNVGASGRCTWAQLVEMENNGHCIQNQTKSHTSLGTLSEAQQEAELTGARDAMQANGLLTGWAANNWKYMTYPNGSYDSNTPTAFDAVGMRLGWNTPGGGGYYGLPFGQKYMLPFTHLTAATSIETIKGYIDGAIDRGMLFMCYVEDLDSTSISYSTFTQMIDYLATKSSQIYAVTSNDLYQLQSGSVAVSKSR
jgi:hypothetical protein